MRLSVLSQQLITVIMMQNHRKTKYVISLLEILLQSLGYCIGQNPQLSQNVCEHKIKRMGVKKYTFDLVLQNT